MIIRALSTTERASRFSVNIDLFYASCGQVEDDAHLFFNCNLRAVWFSFTPSLRIESLHRKMMECNLFFKLFANNITNELLSKILIILWFI